ncbi:MAG TPA: site-2 protease family protein [Trebonia sp.]|nr:site-2 protease family protein [Trebonia sp.]
MALLGWLIFLFALLFSVALHELGHLTTAKSFGMKATKYFVGMGPSLWSFRRGETEYGIAAFPIGGYVKIIGMTSLEEVDPADEPRALRSHPAWERVIVLAAGSFMHFVLALVLLFGAALAIGIENDNSTQLGTVSACLPASEGALTAGTPCASGSPKSPAGAAGLRPGDVVTSFDGVRTGNYDQLTTAIKDAKAGTTVPVMVERDGKPLTLHATLAAVPGRPGGFLGISGATVFQRASPGRAVTYAGSNFGQVVTGWVKVMGELPTALPHLFASNRAQTSAGSLSSVVGDANATGQALTAPVGWQPKVAFILLLVASLNIVVGVFNLLPILPLDGGHILAVVIERIRSRWARLRRRPDPGLFDVTRLMPVSLSLFAVLVVLGVALIAADIVNPVNIG